MTLTEIVIQSLLESPKTPSGLARATGRSIRSVNQVLQRLLQRGHVRKMPNLLDMRERVYSLVTLEVCAR